MTVTASRSPTHAVRRVPLAAAESLGGAAPGRGVARARLEFRAPLRTAGAIAEERDGASGRERYALTLIVGPVSNAQPRVVGLHLAFPQLRPDVDSTTATTRIRTRPTMTMTTMSRRDIGGLDDDEEDTLPPFFRSDRVREDDRSLAQRENPDSSSNLPSFAPLAMPAHARSLSLSRFFLLFLSFSLPLPITVQHTENGSPTILGRPMLANSRTDTHYLTGLPRKLRSAGVPARPRRARSSLPAVRRVTRNGHALPSVESTSNSGKETFANTNRCLRRDTAYVLQLALHRVGITVCN